MYSLSVPVTLYFHDWRRVIFGFVTLFIIGVVLDWIINSARQSVQFFIFSKKYDEIADRIIKDADRGVTVLDGTDGTVNQCESVGSTCQETSVTRNFPFGKTH